MSAGPAQDWALHALGPGEGIEYSSWAWSLWVAWSLGDLHNVSQPVPSWETSLETVFLHHFYPSAPCSLLVLWSSSFFWRQATVTAECSSSISGFLFFSHYWQEAFFSMLTLGTAGLLEVNMQVWGNVQTGELWLSTCFSCFGEVVCCVTWALQGPAALPFVQLSLLAVVVTFGLLECLTRSLALPSGISSLGLMVFFSRQWWLSLCCLLPPFSLQVLGAALNQIDGDHLAVASAGPPPITAATPPCWSWRSQVSWLL